MVKRFAPGSLGLMILTRYFAIDLFDHRGSEMFEIMFPGGDNYSGHFHDSGAYDDPALVLPVECGWTMCFSRKYENFPGSASITGCHIHHRFPAHRFAGIFIGIKKALYIIPENSCDGGRVITADADHFAAEINAP